MDLSRLYAYIGSADFSGRNIWERIWNASGTLAGGSTRGMLGWNLICYGIKRSGNVHWLPALSALVVFGVLGMMIVKYAQGRSYSSRAVAVSFMLTFMGLQVQYVLSGVRNALAVTLMLLGCYLLFYEKKRYALAILLIFAAVTVHPSALILLVPIALCRAKRQWPLRIFALFTLPILFLLARLLANAPIGFISTVANRILFYTNTEYPYDRPEMIANIAVFLTTLLTYRVLEKGGAMAEPSTREIHYMNAYELLGLMMIGCVVRRDFTLRIGYFMGILSAPVACRIFFDATVADKRKKLLFWVLAAVILVCCGKVYYDSAWVISQWDFG